ncbi:hypothetical protein BLNAU_15077 [Blattamonas nauphoetae]|uniref:Uncharacterized protein n=1 Tax=Blattamonas nauphoetae TaxID=2049346 RepID=A0ABQ9XFC6_9EUKA|nr:hypothetical protein BLNAU_15077 [Blattamonas nauphoetae]
MHHTTTKTTITKRYIEDQTSLEINQAVDYATAHKCSFSLRSTNALQWTKKQDEFFANKLNILKAATVEWRSPAAAFSTKIPDSMEYRWRWVDTILDFIDKYGQSVKVVQSYYLLRDTGCFFSDQ